MKDLALGLVVLVALGLTWGNWNQWQERKEWEARAEAAVDSAQADSVRAAKAIARADTMKSEADRLQRVADSLGRRTRERVVEIREVEVPEYVVPFVAPRDSIIDDLLAENDTLRRTNLALRSSNTQLRMAVDRITASESALREVLEDRPQPRSRWLPSMGLGAFAGACSDGTACSGIGITASWEIPLP